jgi:hypothetical protein
VLPLPGIERGLPVVKLKKNIIWIYVAEYTLLNTTYVSSYNVYVTASI